MSSKKGSKKQTTKESESSESSCYKFGFTPGANTTFTCIKEILLAKGWEMTGPEDPNVNFFIPYPKPKNWPDLNERCPFLPEPENKNMKRLLPYKRGFSRLSKSNFLIELRRYNEEVGTVEYDFNLPVFWVNSSTGSMPMDDIAQAERKSFLAKAMDMKAQGKTWWIIKPGQGAKGVGIKVCSQPEEVLPYIDANPPAARDPLTGALDPMRDADYVVQKYLENPLLVDGFKFDMRVMAFLTPRNRLYFCDNLNLRLCATPFSLANPEDTISHISNNCVQRTASNYGSKFADQTIFSDGFETFLQQEFKGQRTVEKDILPEVRRCIINSLKPIVTQFQSVPGVKTYQSLGFDIMFDTDFKAYLLEINTTPGCDPRLRDPFLEGLTQLVFDTVFPLTKGPRSKNLRLKQIYDYSSRATSHAAQVSLNRRSERLRKRTENQDTSETAPRSPKKRSTSTKNVSFQR